MTEYVPFSIKVGSFKFFIVIKICHFPSGPKAIKVNSVFHGVSCCFSSSLRAQFFLILFAPSAIAILARIVASIVNPADSIKKPSATEEKTNAPLLINVTFARSVPLYLPESW